MIDPDIILKDLRTQLARRIAARPHIPRFEPLPITPWIAMSLMQKAIRRGRAQLALQAAATLLVNAPDRLWRRCGGIAFEDIGVADPETVGLVTAALGGKRIRIALAGEWSVASLIVEAMASARKCRSADDLLMGVERHPTVAEARRKQAELSIDQLRRIVLGEASLHERALALWYMLGTDRRPSPHLATRRGEPAFVFDVLDELGTPMTMVEITREGFRRTREALCPFVALLIIEGKPDATAVEDDDAPPEVMIGPIPGWALDTYTREGRAALSRFVRSKSDTARWLRDQVPPARRVDFLGGVLFRVEGQVTAHRLRWALGDELRRLVDIECQGVTSAEAAEVLALMRADIPHLNGVRAEVMGSVRHAG